MSSEENQDRFRKEIQHREALNKLKAQLVRWGDELAKDSPARFATQLSLAQEVANQESEPAVVKNFLAYQAARGSKKDPGWRHNNLYRKAAEHIESIDKATKSDSDTEENRVLRQKAISLYFGYARRSYVAIDKLERRSER